VREEGDALGGWYRPPGHGIHDSGMPPSKIDLNLFIVFEAVYRTRNLTRAAQTLFITQPAVSNALARMRKNFDDPLFVSTPAGMMPAGIVGNASIRRRRNGPSG
jgi:hypothetical protein